MPESSSNVDDVRARFGATAERVADHARQQIETVREQLRAFVAPSGDERARDPSHTRTLPDVDFRQLFEANGLVLIRTRFQTHRRELDYYLDLAGCEGDARERAKQLSPGGPQAYVAESGWYLLRKP